MKVEPIAVGCIANGITHRGNVYDQSAVDALQARIADLERAGYVVSMTLLQSGTYHTLCDEETKASVDVFKPRTGEQK